MILYRIQISADTSWTVELFGHKAEAETAFKRCCTAIPRDISLDEMDVPTTGRDLIAVVLNRAQVERSNWPGENISKRMGRSAKTKPATSALEGLL